MPRLPKIKLSFEGRRYRTDRNGLALVRGVASREELERKLRVGTTRVRRGVRARFGGWHMGRLALTLDYFVRPRFVDVHGKVIDPGIDSITLKSSFGVPVRYAGARIGWVEGRACCRRATTSSRSSSSRASSV